MATKSFQMDMSKGPIFKNTVRFAIPLILASLLQLLYNAADLVVVSRYAGSNAMAAVGATGALTNLLINVFMGISMGAGVAVSRKFGADDRAGMRRTVHTAILLGIVLGIIAGIIGVFFSKKMLVMMGTPQGEVLDGATIYMKIMFLGVPASLSYNFGAAILRAVGDTKRPLYILALTGLVNVFLNLVLVIGFHMGVAGVAIATAVANYLSFFAVIWILCRADKKIRISFKRLGFYKKELIEILQIGIPAGIQSSFFSLANTVIQSSVNAYGPAAVAGHAAGASIDGFIYVSMNALYHTCMTGVSQNYGAKNEKRINKTIWVSLACVSVVGIFLGVLSVAFSKQLLGIYINDSAEAMMYGAKRMLYVGLAYFLCGIMEVLTGALRGLGCSVTPAISSFVGSCGFRIFWVMVVVKLIGSTQIDILYLCWPISWVMVNVFHIITLIIVKPRAIRHMHLR